ncbi:hypothetical protein D3C76_1850120 [compost metagenome]
MQRRAELTAKRAGDRKHLGFILDLHQQCRRPEDFMGQCFLGQETLAVDFKQC